MPFCTCNCCHHTFEISHVRFLLDEPKVEMVTKHIPTNDIHSNALPAPSSQSPSEKNEWAMNFFKQPPSDLEFGYLQRYGLKLKDYIFIATPDTDPIDEVFEFITNDADYPFGKLRVSNDLYKKYGKLYATPPVIEFTEALCPNCFTSLSPYLLSRNTSHLNIGVVAPRNHAKSVTGLMTYLNGGFERFLGGTMQGFLRSMNPVLDKEDDRNRLLADVENFEKFGKLPRATPTDISIPVSMTVKYNNRPCHLTLHDFSGEHIQDIYKYIKGETSLAQNVAEMQQRLNKLDTYILLIDCDELLHPGEYMGEGDTNTNNILNVLTHVDKVSEKNLLLSFTKADILAEVNHLNCPALASLNGAVFNQLKTPASPKHFDAELHEILQPYLRDWACELPTLTSFRNALGAFRRVDIVFSAPLGAEITYKDTDDDIPSVKESFDAHRKAAGLKPVDKWAGLFTEGLYDFLHPINPNLAFGAAIYGAALRDSCEPW